MANIRTWPETQNVWYPWGSPNQEQRTVGSLGAAEDGKNFVKPRGASSMPSIGSFACLGLLVFILLVVLALGGYVLYPRTNGVNIFTPPTDDELAAAGGGGGGDDGGGDDGGGGSLTCPGSSWTLDTTIRKCYQSVTTPVNIDDAKAGCTTLNAAANLVSVKSSEEDQALATLHTASATTDCDSDGYWTSGVRPADSNELNEFVWKDGTSVTYTNWAVGEPNNLNSGCLAYRVPVMKWQDKRCGNAVMACYICQIDL